MTAPVLQATAWWPVDQVDQIFTRVPKLGIPSSLAEDAVWRRHAPRPIAAVVALLYLLPLLALLPLLWLGAAVVGGAQAARDLRRGP